MSFIISLQTEILKTKRSAAFLTCLIGSGFIPAILTLMYIVKPDQFVSKLKEHPWELHFLNGWQAFSVFLLPIFIIIVCSMMVQIEYKNNTWKQVFASPQSTWNIFFSKFTTIILMIVFLLLMFNFFMLGGPLVSNLIHKEYDFFRSNIDYGLLVKTNLKFFISLLGMISIQYWLSLRIKNFIVPIAIGLALLIVGMIIQQWEHIGKFPYAFPFLTFLSVETDSIRGSLLLNHELNSIGYFVIFTLLAFLDMRLRKERG